MSTPFSRGTPPPRKIRVILPGGTDESETRDYPMRELTEREFRTVREAIRFARDRIKANGGRCGYKVLDKHSSRSGTGWAKKLLKNNARKWSCNDALKLADAVRQCEMERVVNVLRAAAGGVSEQELQRRYNDQRAEIIAETQKTTGELVGGTEIMQGGAIPAEYADWLASQCDYATLSALQGTQHALLYRQIAGAEAKSGQPYSCPFLYEPDAAHVIASEIARYLADQGVIYGARKDQRQRAYEALIKLFGEPEDEEMPSFRDRCRWAFWSSFRRWNPLDVAEIENRMRTLNEKMP